MPKLTYRQFSAAMRDAGWKNAGQGLWVHQDTGAKFYAWNATANDNGRMVEAWAQYAKQGKTPEVQHA